MKKYLILILIVLLIGVLTIGVLAGKSGQAGKSNVAHLYLYEKTPLPLTEPPEETDPWPIVEGGAWGKMKYNLSGEEFEFVFNGHGLEPGEDYTLIYYPDPWPGNANVDGDVHIAGSVDTGDLPTTDDEAPLGGAKIWLVLSSDVDCDVEMIGWNAAEYLFEGDVITFDDTSE